MANDYAKLVQRVSDLIGRHVEWFDLVARWYEDSRATKKVMLKLWVPDVEPACRPLLSVNGKFLDDAARDRRSSSHHLFWIIPPSLLKAGDNDIFLWVDRAKGPAMDFGAVTVEQAEMLPRDVQRDSRPRPVPSKQVSVTFRLGEDFRPGVDRWQTHIHHDTLKFNLLLADRVPPRFTLGVAALLPGEGYEVDLDALWDLVEDLVKDKIKELVQELARDPSKRIVEMQLDDLKAYQKLHRTDLADALGAKDSESLDDIRGRKGRKSAPSEKKVKPAQAAMSGGAKFFLFLVLMTGAVAIAWYNGWIDAQTLGRIQAALTRDRKQQPRFHGPGGVNGPGREIEDQLTRILEGKKAKGGEVQISLMWHNKNDLDLHVIAPSGERIYFNNRKSKCQGELDVDMNQGGYQSAVAEAAENIAWPAGQAPRGHYKIIVKHFSNQGMPDTRDPTRFSVRVRVRGEERWFHNEVVRADPVRHELVVHEFDLN